MQMHYSLPLDHVLLWHSSAALGRLEFQPPTSVHIDTHLGNILQTALPGFDWPLCVKKQPEQVTDSRLFYSWFEKC